MTLYVQEGLRTWVSKRDTPQKWFFFDIDLSSVKTVANRHRHVAHYNKHWRRAF